MRWRLKSNKIHVRHCVMKRILVLGGGVFIGGHLVRKLVNEGCWVRLVDIKENLYESNPHHFICADLTVPDGWQLEAVFKTTLLERD